MRKACQSNDKARGNESSIVAMFTVRVFGGCSIYHPSGTGSHCRGPQCGRRVCILILSRDHLILGITKFSGPNSCVEVMNKTSSFEVQVACLQHLAPLTLWVQLASQLPEASIVLSSSYCCLKREEEF